MKKIFNYGIAALLCFGVLLFIAGFYYTLTCSMKPAVILLASMMGGVAIIFGIVKLFEIIKKKRIIKPRWVKCSFIVAYSLMAVFCVVYAISVYCSFSVEMENNFELTTDFFSNKKVMVIIPHQDDDILMVGGMVEEYAKAGSEVSVVFATHGDAADIAERRINEAKSVLGKMGVKTVHFLGFGNRWQKMRFDGQEVEHIYNSPDGDAVWTSVNGKTKTYDVKNQSSYYQAEYTRNNFLESIKKVITDNRPDVIYAVDYDNHIDHKAVGLLFDEAMGIILKESDDYRPEVFKGFAYGTSWTAKDTFLDSFNLQSSIIPDETVWRNSAAGFSWNDRVRIPIEAENTNRIATKTPVYKALQGYESQFASQNTGRVLKGDRVFWIRKTNSVLYRASIVADGKATNRLNDFKIKDSDDISVAEQPNGGVVCAGRFDVNMDKSKRIDTVTLYDSADETCNILEGYLEFGNGDKVPFGALEKDGSASVINFDEREIDEFSIIITKSEGDMVGLTEIEAYNEDNDEGANPLYIMPVDDGGNFAYNYWIENDDSAEFSLYAYPNVKLNSELIKVTYEGDDDTSCVFENGKIVVKCPSGKELKIKVTYDEKTAVKFFVRNPGWWEETSTSIMRFFNKSFIYFDKLNM